MAIVGTTYRIYYTASNYTSGLTDVTVTIRKPDGTEEGPFSMGELDTSGVYYYDYTIGDLGQFLFTSDSTSAPSKFSRSLEAELEAAYFPTADFG